jgi:hypothetical protein
MKSYDPGNDHVQGTSDNAKNRPEAFSAVDFNVINSRKSVFYTT